jgi:uncharacterized protein YutE (UPF0331/DUF86 family)
VGEETYLTDPFVQDVVERNLQVASQVILDVCTHLIAGQGWQSPDTYEDAIVILAQRGAIPDALAERLRGMAGFRNILVHEYLEIDSQIVYEVATDHLDDYEEFARCVAAWVERVEAL